MRCRSVNFNFIQPQLKILSRVPYKGLLNEESKPFGQTINLKKIQTVVFSCDHNTAQHTTNKNQG